MIEFLSPTGLVPSLRASSKKQALSELSRRAAEITGIPDRTIFDVLLEREKLGSTGVGRGVAIPHGRLQPLDRVFGVFARLERPIDFDAVDDQPVDLIFLLLAPANAGADHLKALAKVSRLMRDQGLCAKLRGCESREAIYALLNSNPAAVA